MCQCAEVVYRSRAQVGEYITSRRLVESLCFWVVASGPAARLRLMVIGGCKLVPEDQPT